MSSSCPYCGAVLKLKFCVVCGRQGKLNKMGNLRSTVRNTDITRRLEDPFNEDEEETYSPKALRFRRGFRPAIEATISGVIAGILMFCAAKQAFDLYSTGEVQNMLMPWMRSHRFVFRANWPILPKPGSNQINSNYNESKKQKFSFKKNSLKKRKGS